MDSARPYPNPRSPTRLQDCHVTPNQSPLRPPPFPSLLTLPSLLVLRKSIDTPHILAYIRYHIVFRACLRAVGSLRVLRVLWKHPGKTT